MFDGVAGIPTTPKNGFQRESLEYLEMARNHGTDGRQVMVVPISPDPP